MSLPLHIRARCLNSFMAGKQKHAYRKRVADKNENMTDAPKQKKTSKMMALLYIVLGIIILTMFLELTGIADVAGKREHQEIIDKPHD